MSTPLRDFTGRLLARHGALVEYDDDGLVAVAPPALASLLEIADYQRLTFGSRTAAERDTLGVDYDSPLVGRFERLMGELGHAAVVSPPHLPLKRIDPAAALNEAITVANGVVRDCRAEPGDARYVGFFVEYELLADERVSGMIEIWVNLTMRSAPRFAGLTEILLANSSAEGAQAGDAITAVADAWTPGARLAKRAVEHRLQDTLDSLRRRRQRDFIRLQDYYGAIDDEIRQRVRRARAKLDDRAVKAEVSRLEATASTYRDRIAELVDRYRARIHLRPIAALVCTLTVHRITARFHRRSTSRAVTVAWNPIDRSIEPPCCEACGTAAPTVVLCDDRVHLLCMGCHTACLTCGRAYCRACHARCPRRHEADTPLAAPQRL
ncbi:MAG: hypothetical protein AUH43_08700 [Acidobacteria bacterium 13_1_40CM_65_14]|nr:MAG: hypothetical protein AUH43_08700 [Acidobacteria bacterium 13_1_40CM_65_14]